MQRHNMLSLYFVTFVSFAVIFQIREERSLL